MNRRSRAGCVDCRRAKVKCDEIRPSCGTCKRRRRVCQGYNKARNHEQPLTKAASSPQSVGGTKRSRSSSMVMSTASPRGPSWECNELSPTALARPTDGSTLLWPRRRSSLSIWSMPLIPPGMINPRDESTIEVYFNRHPCEMVIGSEFVNEMNANVLVVLQHNPKAVRDSLSGIGQVYLSKEQPNAVVPVLDRRARILANLRGMGSEGYCLEQQVVLLLGLSAMELIDTTTEPKDTTIPALIANSAALIRHHVCAGREVSLLARYFIRALARQDMIVSLTYQRRPLISTSVWLHEEFQSRPDRLMGYTATLMPLLTELSALAEDAKGIGQSQYITNSELVSPAQDSFLERAAVLRSMIEAWHPNSISGVSFGSSRKFLAQAYAYRSAALLYLYRLFHPPQTSPEADQVALAMAHDVLLYTCGPREELRMLLWPVFIAACETLGEEDRLTVLDVFDAICEYRKTATALRTKRFCIDRVWKARDSGMEWDWMRLVESYPGECLPI